METKDSAKLEKLGLVIILWAVCVQNFFGTNSVVLWIILLVVSAIMFGQTLLTYSKIKRKAKDEGYLVGQEKNIMLEARRYLLLYLGLIIYSVAFFLPVDAETKDTITKVGASIGFLAVCWTVVSKS